MKIDGTCHCGAISFTATVDPSRVFACHCTDCQILSSAPFRVSVAAPIASVTFVGEPTRYVKVAESGARRTQAFCSQCGTGLYASAVENPTHVNLRVGAIRQRALLKPTLQLWKRSAPPWLDSLSSVPACLEQELFKAQ